LYRLKQVTHPDGGTISYTYNTGASLPWNVTTTVAVNSTQNASSKTVMDGLGRVVQSQNLSDPSGIDYVDTTYNNLGQVYTASNPYRAKTDSTYGLFTYGYDALGRVASINQPDNSNISRTYTNRALEVQEYATHMNKQTIYQSDGLGRLQYVCEITSVTQQGNQGSPTACPGLDINGSGFETAYTYDALGNLLTAGNSTNSRTFVYDGLSRLTSSTEPELNTNKVQYSYDTQMAGDVYQRIAPAPNQTSSATVTTTYTHDGLHRLTAVTYSDGTTPWTTLAYDQSTNWTANISNGKGRLTGAFVCPSGTSGPTCGTTNPSSIGTIFSYDPVGRVQWDAQCTPTNCGISAYSLNYTYDYVGDELTANSGNGITWTNTFNSIGQLTQISTNWLSPTQSGTLVSGIAHNALSQPTSDLLSNGIQESWSWLPMRAGGYSAGTYNFGNTSGVGPFIEGANDSVNGNWTYTYDNFQRLGTSSCSGGCPLSQSSVGFNYLYDPVGNRWKQTLNCTNCTGPQPQYAFGSWNHISGSGVAYDSAGNMTADGLGYTYFYDAENRLIQVDNGSAASYKYDAMGRRVTQTTSGASFEYLMDLHGNPVTKLVAGTSTTSSSEVFIGGRHWGTDVMSSSMLFMHTDWLGTGRSWTNLSGQQVQYCQSFPFGDSLYCGGNANNTDDNFTGMTYDFEDGMYHASFREVSPVQGRWMRPDPAGLAAVDPSNPQTWNRYAYVTNNPVSFRDPTGLINPAYACWYCGGGGSSIFSGGDLNYTVDTPYALPVVGGSLGNNAAANEAAWLGSGSIKYYSVQGGNLMINTGYTFVPGFCPSGSDCGGSSGTLLPTWLSIGSVGYSSGNSNGSSWWNGLGLAAGAFFRSPRAIALADQAKSFGKQIQNAGQKANDGWTWADNAALDWERDFMSEETKQLKELLDSGAEGLIQAADFIESNLPELETDITLIIP
jgi:RHS repeat-associated protein